MRKLIWIAAGLALLAGMAAGIGWLGRHALVAYVVQQVLADRGVAQAELTVETVATDRLVLRDIRLGGHDELAIRTLDVRFDLWDALAEGLVEADIEGLVLRVNATGDGPPLGDLHVLVDRREAGQGGTVPPIHIRDGQVIARTPAGEVRVAFDGDVLGEQSGSLVASATMAARSPYGSVQGEAAVTVDADGITKAGLIIDRGDLSFEDMAFGGVSGQLDAVLADDGLRRMSGTLRASETRRGEQVFGGWQSVVNVSPQDAEITFKTATGEHALPGFFADLALTVRGYRHAPDFDGRISLELGTEGPWQALAAPVSWSRAKGVLSIQGSSQAFDFAKPPDQWLRSLDLIAEGAVELTGISVPDALMDGRAELRTKARIAAGEIDIEIDPGSTITGRASDKLVAGLPSEISPIFQKVVSLSLGVDGNPVTVQVPAESSEQAMIAGPLSIVGGGAAMDATVDGVLDGTGVSGTVDTTWRLATVRGKWGEAHGLSGRTAGLVTAGANGQWSAVMTDPGQITVQSVRTEQVDAKQPVSATVSNAMAFGGSKVPVFSGAVEVAKLTLDLKGNGTVGLENVVVRVKNSGPGNAIDINGTVGAAVSPENLVRANAVKFDAVGIEHGWPRKAELTVGVLTDLREPAFVAPLNVTAKLTEDGGIRVDARDAWKTLHVGYLGRRNADGDIAGTFQLEALKFGPQSSEIDKLFPFLHMVREVSGTVEAGGRLDLVGGQPSGDGWVDIRNVSAVVSGVPLKDVSGRIVADSLFPLRLPEGQTLRLASLDPAIPLTEGEIRFHVPGTTPMVLVLERAGVAVAGGQVTLGRTILDPARPAQALTLQLADIDLAQLFALAPVEGLQVEGTVSGALPVVAGARGWRVDDGALGAIEPGVIRFRSDAATAALRQGGQAVELMLQALEDFRYQDLSAKVDKAEDGSTKIGLSLLGHNPAVMDGHPFRFNINLEGNLDRVLLALRQGLTLSDEIIRRGTGR